MGYLIYFGLAPYFRDELMKALTTCKHFTLYFDQSLNKIAQRGQVDVTIRFMMKRNS